MKLLLSFALALAARAQTPLQVDLYRLTGTGAEIAVTSPLEVGPAAAGDFTEVRLRLRSRETQSIILNTNQMYAATTGAAPVFSAENYPSLPYSIARGTNVDFRVRFAPKDPGTYQGVLYVLDKKITLTGTAPEGATVQVQRGTAFETLQTSSAPVDFGAVERKQSAVRQFAIINRTAQPVTIRTIIVTGAGYGLEGITAPVTLAAGTTRTFVIRFAPLQSGILRGDIFIDGRTFQLEGFALEPPFPTLSFDTLPAVRNGQQATVKIRLSEASRALGSVRILLAGIETDPAVALLPGGGRTASIALKEGDRELSTIIQTGSTAGTLKLTVEVGAQRIEAQLVLAPMVPSVATITLTRANGRIDLRASGFDNVRAMREAAFQFYDRAGAPVGGMIRAAVTDAFNRYFATSTLGGLFSLTASFPVVGDIDAVAGVEVELSNNQGTARGPKIAF